MADVVRDLLDAATSEGFSCRLDATPTGATLVTGDPDSWWRASGNEGDLYVNFPSAMGAIVAVAVAVADLVDICNGTVDSLTLKVPCECDEWAARGQYHWRLANVRPLAEPVPCRGALGLWTLPDDVEAAVLAALGSR